MTYQHQIDRAEATLDRIAANLKRTENLLAAVLDTLVAIRPENMPKRMPSVPGAHYAAAFPPVSNPQDEMGGEPISLASLQGMIPADDPRSSIDPRYRFDGSTMGRAYTEVALIAPIPQQITFTPSDLHNRLGITGTWETATAIPLPPARPAGSLHVTGPNGELPDSAGTPGAINPDVTEATLKATIGTPGWTATVRPSTTFTDALKAQISAEYGLTGSLSAYECDHLIPLCCGGHPTSQQNLWNQRRAGVNGASLKDITEVLAQHAILAGHISLQEAQDGFRHDWTALHARLTSNPQVMRLLMAMEPPDEEP